MSRLIWNLRLCRIFKVLLRILNRRKEDNYLNRLQLFLVRNMVQILMNNTQNLHFQGSDKSLKISKQWITLISLNSAKIKWWSKTFKDNQVLQTNQAKNPSTTVSAKPNSKDNGRSSSQSDKNQSPSTKALSWKNHFTAQIQI